MKHCQTCRFRAAPREEERYDYKTDEMIKNVHSTCVRVIHGGDMREGPRELGAKQPAVVIDGSSYQAALLVLPDFGCVLHEEGVHSHSEEE